MTRANARLASLPGGEVAMRCMASSLEESTSSGYSGRWADFSAYCLAAGLPSLPASSDSVLGWMGTLAPRVGADSLCQYLAAVNKAHEDAGFAKPAQGPRVTACRRGMSRLQEAGSPLDERIPLPASFFVAVLERAEEPSCPLLVLRAAAAVLAALPFFARADTGTGCLVQDLFAAGDSITFRERRRKGHNSGGVRRVLQAQAQEPSPGGVPSLIPRISNVLRQWSAARSRAWHAAGGSSDLLWQLPSDGGTAWRASLMDDWLQVCLMDRCISAPPSFKYTSHSIRKAAASLAFAIDVQLARIEWYGGWTDGSRTVFSYIDRSVAPCSHAWALFGHLLVRPPAVVPV